MPPAEPLAALQPVLPLFDALSDAVVLLDRHAVIAFANAAARQAGVAAPGASVEALRGQIGDAAVQWVRQAVAGRRPRTSLPAARLPGGGAAALSWHALNPAHSALQWLVPPAVSGTGEALPASVTAPADPLVERLRLLWESPIAALLLDAAYRIVDANAAFVRLVGYSRDRLIGIDPVELQPEEDRATTRNERRQVPDGATDVPLVERRLQDAAGRVRWCRVAERSIAEGGVRRYHLSLLQDTTAEHVARERAERSVRELDDWFVLSPIGMVLYDDDGLLVRTNPAFEVLVGTLPVSLDEASEAVRELLAWGDTEATSRLHTESTPLLNECWYPQPGGGLRRLRATVRSYQTPGGQWRFMAVVEDLTIEEERDLAQLQIGALIDTAGVGLATFQENSGWVRHQAGPGSRAHTSGPAAAPSAALQSISRDVVLPESLPEYERLQHALRHAERVEVRFAILHPVLGERWLLTRVEPARLASGKQTTSVVTLDVTEQQQTQARSEQLLRELTTILESSTAGIAYLRGPLLMRCNRPFKAMLGLPRGELAGSSIHELFGHEPQAQHLVAATMQALAEGRRYETEIEIPQLPRRGVRRAPREARWLAVSARRSGPGESIVVLSDITRLKVQQRELETLARDHALMFNLTEIGIAFVRDGLIRRANDALQVLTGYAADELQRLPDAALFADRETRENVAAQQEQALALHGRWSGEWQLRRKDGRLLWVQVSQRLVADGDPSAGVIGAYVNVDDRHRAERMVALQAERTRVVLDSVLVGIVTVGVRGIEWMNRSARRMFGGDLQDFINQPLATVATPEDDHPFRHTHLLGELLEGEAHTFECRVKARDGREFWVVGNAVGTGGGSAGRQLTYALLDIDRRRQAEAERLHAQASLQRLIEAAPLAITLRDASSLEVLHVNQVAASSAGRTPQQLVGTAPEAIYPAPMAAERRQDMERALATPGVTQREYRIAGRGTTEIWDARYMPLAATAGAPPDQLLLVATNVTEQRQAQQAQFDAAIAQREMLVKEVHHRIKNNLQGVVGLMQQIAQRKPEVATAIAEVVGQVQAIAQVYGLQVGSTGPLHVRGVVEAIAQSVQRTFGRTIALQIDPCGGVEWLLPEAESIPIALAVNELLTNAIKHSPPDAPVGCTLDCDDDGVRLTIANDAQLPADFELARYPGGVSGLGLVQALLPRRSATLSLAQCGARVEATVALRPPAVARQAPEQV